MQVVGHLRGYTCYPGLGQECQTCDSVLGSSFRKILFDFALGAFSS